MASSSSTSAEAGFATPAATVMSLALGLVASAVTASAVMELRLARSDLERLTAQYALAGVSQQAALAVVGAKQGGRLQWTLATEEGPARVLAEPEDAKLALASASALDGRTLGSLNVADPEALRSRLLALAAKDPSDFDVANADPSPLWRACARTIVSPYGGAKTLSPQPAQAPLPGPISWRIGQAWRLRVIGANGWSEDRIVRFTGDPMHPAAVVERRLTRSIGGEGACETLIAATSATAPRT